MYNKTLYFNKDSHTPLCVLESLPLSMTHVLLSVLLLNLTGDVSLFVVSLQLSLASINANGSTKVHNNILCHHNVP